MPALLLITEAVLDLLHSEAVALADMLEFNNIQVIDTEAASNRSAIITEHI